jgi:hypothetical protein
MIDVLALLGVLLASAAAGLVTLRCLGALPEAPGERWLAGLGIGLGLAGAVGLGLAATGALRFAPVIAAGALALLVGGRELWRAMGATRLGGMGRLWPILLPCAVVLATELVAIIAPPVGGDQTKYHLVYPRLYARHGGLVPTPWTFWGQMQFLPNFVFALAFVLRDVVLARMLNAVYGVLAACAIGALVRRHLSSTAGAAAGVLLFTLPISWSLMARAGVDLAVILYAALSVGALLDWMERGRGGDLRLAALAAGLAGGSKTMGLLVPALGGLALLGFLLRRGAPVRRMLAPAATFGFVALVAASPCYVRNAVETGNPLYPFGYGLFGGTNWSRQAGEYLDEYYRQYQTTYASKRDAEPYAGLELARFPWDLTMHPESFENAPRQGLDVGPFALAFVPALWLMRRRRAAALLVGGIGLAYAGIIAVGAWAHPRYVVPGVALMLAAAVPAARALLGARLFVGVLVLTVAGNLALTGRLLEPMWPDQLRVAAGRMEPEAFLRRWSRRYAFWERANTAIPETGRVLVLEKIPHPYYIERPFVLASYLEQGLIDYRALTEPGALADAARTLGCSHMAVDVAALDASGDPFETSVARLWRGLVAAEGELVLRHGGYALYAIRPATAFAAGSGADRG